MLHLPDNSPLRGLPERGSISKPLMTASNLLFTCLPNFRKSLSKLCVTLILYLSRFLQLLDELPVAPHPSGSQILLRFPHGSHRLFVPQNVEGLDDLLEEGAHFQQERSVFFSQENAIFRHLIH